MRPEELRRVRIIHERYADAAGMISPDDAFEAALDVLDIDAGLSMLLRAEAIARHGLVSVSEIMRIAESYEPPARR
jgi:hypothetical protein